MTSTEFFEWWIVARAEAAHRYPGAEPDLQSVEVRHLPAPGEMLGNSKPPVEARSVAEPHLSSCAFCEGSGWVCADHPALPFEHDDCGAEGAACVCNPEGAMQWQHIYAEVPTDKPRH